jgi:CRISPR-associated protein Cmr5
MTMTLEQQRAADAWQCAEGCRDDYAKLAKGAPALIMNSGLIQVLAFLHEKGQKDKNGHHDRLGAHLRQWLSRRFPGSFPDSNFEPFMNALMHVQPQVFQDITAEAMAWLRWQRQIASARSTGPSSADS